MLCTAGLAVNGSGGQQDMRIRKNAPNKITAICMVVVLCAIMMFGMVAMSYAGDGQGVSVKVSIGPSIHVDADGSVRSNVSALAFGGDNFYTIVAR
jgi:hypothetical protein